MTARAEKLATSRRQPDTGRTAARSPLPPPEEIFVDWLMSVTPDDCLEAAARHQIEMIDRSPVFLHPDVRHLRMLLVAIAGDSEWPMPISNP